MKTPRWRLVENLPPLVCQPVEAHDEVGELPRLPRPKDHRGEDDRMERNVVLCHELGVVDVVGLRISAIVITQIGRS
jgi:hypothetical protein